MDSPMSTGSSWINNQSQFGATQGPHPILLMLRVTVNCKYEASLTSIS